VPESYADSQSRPDGEGAEIRTFLIADVRGYTLFTQERGDEAAAKLAGKFATLAREAVSARGGEVIELRGDEALAVFGSARQAIRAAVDLQLRFAEETVDDPSLPLPVGIGLDAGEAVRVEGGYRGGALNLAARLCGQATAGEILATQEVVHLARKVDGVRYEDRGELHLKNLAEPVRAVKIVPEGVDPSLVVAPHAPARPSPEEPKTAARARSRRRRLIAALVVLAVLAAGIPLVLSKLGGGAPSVELGENAVGVLDTHTGRVVGSIEVGSQPGAIAFGEGAVWVTDADGRVSHVDPTKMRVLQSIPDVGQDLSAIAVGEGAVWVTNAAGGTLSRINPSTDSVVKTIDVGNGPAALAIGGGKVWVADKLDDTVAGIDPDTNDVTTLIPVAGSPSGISYSHGALWVASETEATLTRIDPGTESGEPIQVGNGPRSVVSSRDAVWVANRLDGTVSKVDPDTNHVTAALPTGEEPGGIAVAPGATWVTSEVGGSVTRFAADDNEGTTFEVGAAVLDATVVGDDLWFTSRGAPTDHRGGTLRLVSVFPVDSIDPALADPDILTLVGDGLVEYKRVGGADGSTLVPDLATALPRPTDGGTTYTFRLRTGILYSNGDPVHASDFRRGIERSFRLQSLDTTALGHIRGADACTQTPESCDLSEGIQTDDDAGTVTFHLTTPDPDLFGSLAGPAEFPVPPGVPDEDVGTKPVPSTGPYMITRFEPGKSLELGRNPHFRQWTGNRPDGFPDRVVWRMGLKPTEQLDDVLAGKADVVLSVPLIPAEDLDRAMTQFTQQVHTYLRPGTFSFALNTRLAPFDDVRVRKALNYAVDRRRVLDLFPFPGSEITCQLLPPGVPGYRPYCPYTLDPDTATGTWTAPDRQRAKDLIEASRTKGMRVTVVESQTFAPIARYFVGLLNDLGYHARLRVIPDIDKFFDFVFDTRNDVQATAFSWVFGGSPSSDLILQVASCRGLHHGSPLDNLNVPEFCDPQIEAKIDRARRVQLSDPAAAGPLWTAAEHAVVDHAPYVSLVNPGWVDILSKRVGNYQANPAWGLLFDQLWVR
jgi:YVTN family beta-propeller protein